MDLRNPVWMVGAGAAVVVVVGLAAFALTFTRAKLRLPTVDVGPLPPASPPSDMSISALPTGSYDSPAALTYRGGSWRETRHLAATAVLVRHPKGNLLIDSGFGKNVDEQMKLLPALQRSAHRKDLSVVDRLASGGLGPADLAGVVPTHAHWDHISGLDDLRGVPVFESAAGVDFIASRKTGTEVIDSLPKINYKTYAFEGGAYLGFPRSHDFWGDGSVVIVPAPGHTPDSVVIFVNLPSGSRYALIGDVVFQMEGIEIPTGKPWMLRRIIGENPDEMAENIARIRTAQARYPQIHVIPAHDMRAFSTLPTFPASLN